MKPSRKQAAKALGLKEEHCAYCGAMTNDGYGQSYPHQPPLDCLLKMKQTIQGLEAQVEHLLEFEHQHL